MLDLAALSKMSVDELVAEAQAKPEWYAEVCGQITAAAEDDVKGTQLAYYTPANPAARAVHLSRAREIAVVGGNRSSKTDTMLAELAIRLTGHVPISLMDDYPMERLGRPIRARIVCNSLTDTLEPILKPKLRWDQWNGVGAPEDGRGHWGWLPRHCLVGGQWEKAYSEKYRTLSIAYDTAWRGKHGERWTRASVSTVQFLSYDQDLTAFQGSSLDFIGHDELPPSDIYRENRMRTLDSKGTILTAFTPPDEIGMARADVSWFYDEVYEKGRAGIGKDPGIETVILHTEQNRILDPEEVRLMASRMTDEQREVRLHGNFLHLSGVVYSLFTASSAWWCFRCAKRVTPMDGKCLTCQGDDLETIEHVIEPHPVPSSWPIVFVIDPHPRKKDAMGWFAVTPSDDIVLVAELEADGTAADVKRAVDRTEDALGIRPRRRLMDPNIATETNDKLGRDWTMQRAYDQAGLRCDLAIDDVNVGIQNVNELLKPDQRTRRPRFRAFRTCERFIYGMTHWAWDEWTRASDKDPKEKVRDRYKDFPDLLRYFANSRPTFFGLTRGEGVWHRPRR